MSGCGGIRKAAVPSSRPQIFAGGHAACGKKAATATSLKAAINRSTTGHAVTFTATVTVPGGGTAAGAVTFLAGNTTLGTGTLDSSGTATFSTSGLSAGIYSVVAVYGGSPGCQGSTSAAVTLVAH
jgi:hypothetical protein